MLARPGCPVCHAGRKVATSYLENLLWGSVNDRETRGRLDQSGGFCSQHSRDLLGFSGERLGTAIIQQALLKEALRRLQRTTTPATRSWIQRLQSNWRGGGNDESDAGEGSLRSKGTCPVCDHQQTHERRSVEALVAHVPGELEEPLRQAGGLCWNHLDQALSRCQDPESHAALVTLHESCWEEVIAHLGEFIRKRDYRFSHEPITAAEAEGIQKAMTILTGEYPVP